MTQHLISTEGWRDPADAPRDGTLILGLFRDNGQFVYSLIHWRKIRAGAEAWYEGVWPSEKSPIAWHALPTPPAGEQA